VTIEIFAAQRDEQLPALERARIGTDFVDVNIAIARGTLAFSEFGNLKDRQSLHQNSTG
jgi:hypothetical protein